MTPLLSLNRDIKEQTATAPLSLPIFSLLVPNRNDLSSELVMDFIHLYALSYIVHINDKILLSFDQFHLINCLAVSKSWRHAVVLNKNCAKNKKNTEN